MDDGSHHSTHQFESIKNLIAHLKPGGIYVVEDIHGSCRSWQAMAPEYAPLLVTGTQGCVEQADGTPTFLARVFGWMKMLAAGDPVAELPGVTDIHLFREAVMFQK